jgi:hypothetical protein
MEDAATSLTMLAAKACMPLACATEIAKLASAEASTGFKVWVPFESRPQSALPPFAIMRQPFAYIARPSSSYVGSVFSSLEKAVDAYPCTADQRFIYVPYRMHRCGDPNVVYVYVHDANNITITNIAEDLWEQACAMKNNFLGVESLTDVYDRACTIDEK